MADIVAALFSACSRLAADSVGLQTSPLCGSGLAKLKSRLLDDMKWGRDIRN